MGMNKIDETVLYENIKKLRKRRDYTLQELGDMIGVGRGTIQRYETGEIENISTKTIMKLAEALRVTPAQLVGWERVPDTGNLKLDELFTICVQMDEEQLQTILDVVYTISKSLGNH